MTQTLDRELRVSIVVDPKYRKKAIKVANDTVYRFWKEAMNGGHISRHVRDECNNSVGVVNIWCDPSPPMTITQCSECSHFISKKASYTCYKHGIRKKPSDPSCDQFSKDNNPSQRKLNTLKRKD